MLRRTQSGGDTKQVRTGSCRDSRCSFIGSGSGYKLKCIDYWFHGARDSHTELSFPCGVSLPNRTTDTVVQLSPSHAWTPRYCTHNHAPQGAWWGRSGGSGAGGEGVVPVVRYVESHRAREGQHCANTHSHKRSWVFPSGPPRAEEPYFDSGRFSFREPYIHVSHGFHFFAVVVSQRVCLANKREAKKPQPGGAHHTTLQHPRPCSAATSCLTDLI